MVKFDEIMSSGSKDIFKNAPCLMYIVILFMT